jgi:hypothetical protein
MWLRRVRASAAWVARTDWEERHTSAAQRSRSTAPEEEEEIEEGRKKKKLPLGLGLWGWVALGSAWAAWVAKPGCRGSFGLKAPVRLGWFGFGSTGCFKKKKF